MEINKIYNGDCMTLMGDIDDGVIDLVVTDPRTFMTSRL